MVIFVVAGTGTEMLQYPLSYESGSLVASSTLCYMNQFKFEQLNHLYDCLYFYFITLWKICLLVLYQGCMQLFANFHLPWNTLYYYPYQTSEQVISFMVLPSLSMLERPRWEYILYFPWSRLSYWLCVLTNAGNITLVFCPVLHPGTCGHRQRQKIWKSLHRTNFSQSDEKSHKFAREKWEEGRLSHWRAR